MPTNTDLVKDLPADFDIFGQAVDDRIKALNPSTTLGDIEYRSSTANTNTRLGLGTAGQVLTVNSGANAPEWATPTSGGMTLISTTTLSGATTTISSIPATYNTLYLVIDNARGADDAELRMRFNGDSAANRHYGYNNAFSGAANPFDSTFQRITINTDNTTATAFSTIEIPNYTNTTSWKFAKIIGVNNDETTTTSIRINQSIGAYNQTGAISSLAFFFGSGNAVAGTIKLYGVR